MLVKEVLENEPVPVAEVREKLLQLREERDEDAMGYSLVRALDHVEKFSKLTADQAAELLEELEAMDKVSTEIAVKLVDILPEDADEVRAIYSKERFAIDQEKVEEILSAIEEYR